MSTKRPRSSSPSSSCSSSSPPPSPNSKLLKVVPEGLYTSLTCTLPPTCSYPNKPTHLSSAHEVEEHYAKYHTHVCEHVGCKYVFPDARFLELHFSECHDPIVALKKDRGEKTFACFVVSCPRLFLNPKGRRLHLIQVHGYPKQYFFAVTNKGIGGLLHKWGQAASLYRGDWRSRRQDQDMNSLSDSEGRSKSDNGSEMDITDDSHHLMVDGRERPPHMDRIGNMVDFPTENPPATSSVPPSSSIHPNARDDTDATSLVNAMSSLSFVPDKIRFGRGGKKGGFAHLHLTRSNKTVRDLHANTPTDSVNDKVTDGRIRPPRVRGDRNRKQLKASEGSNGTSGNLDFSAAD